jgi:hypothetical protein
MGSDNNWSAIAAGFGRTVALKTDGTIWSWGYDDTGAIGHGVEPPFYVNSLIPVQESTGASDWSAITANSHQTAALKSDGTLWAWGSIPGGRVWNPTQVGSDTDWLRVFPGNVALKSDGSLWMWGGNGYGQVGDGTTVFKLNPTQVGSDTNWSKAVKGSTTTALKSDGTLWAWGYNVWAQLGDGTTTDRYTPSQIKMGSEWTATFTLESGDTDGTVTFTIDFVDSEGNAGPQVTSTSNSSSVTFDTTPPTLTNVSIDSNNATSIGTNEIAKAGDTVTLSLTADETIGTPTVAFTVNGAPASGSATVTNTSGSNWTATFTLASGDTVGTVAFTIDFSDTAGNVGTQVTSTSDSSSVTFDKPPKLVFATQPVGAGAETTFNTQPVVAIQDYLGNTVTSSTAPVTISITPSTGAAEATLSGTTTVNAVNGVATFAGLSINKLGVYYTLTATSPNLASATSSTLAVVEFGAAPAMGQATLWILFGLFAALFTLLLWRHDRAG